MPTITYNTNAIPTTGLKRLEVLRDGAAAIYGTDAVAGVVNTVLKDNYDGFQIEAQYGSAEGTHLHEYGLNGLWGHNFERGNLTAFFNYDKRTALKSTDQDYTASSDKRPLFVGTAFDGAASLDGRATATPWGSFTAAAAVRQNGTLLTSSAGAFHIQPTTSTGCLASVGTGICIDDAAMATSGDDRNLRFDNQAGVLRVSTPNLDWVMLTHYRAGEWKAGAEAVEDCLKTNRAFHGWGHQFLYNRQTLTLALTTAGFADVTFHRYGKSDRPELADLERHEPSADEPELPHVIIAQATGIAPETPNPEPFQDYHRDVTLR